MIWLYLKYRITPAYTEGSNRYNIRAIKETEPARKISRCPYIIIKSWNSTISLRTEQNLQN